MACMAVTLILASASLLISSAPAPGRSSPSARKQALGPTTLSLACLAAALKATGRPAQNRVARDGSEGTRRRPANLRGIAKPAEGAGAFPCLVRSLHLEV